VKKALIASISQNEEGKKKKDLSSQAPDHRPRRTCKFSAKNWVASFRCWGEGEKGEGRKGGGCANQSLSNKNKRGMRPNPTHGEEQESCKSPNPRNEKEGGEGEKKAGAVGIYVPDFGTGERGLLLLAQ